MTTTPTPVRAPRTAVQGARRIAVIAIIVSLSLTALIGIFTLLSGTFGEAQGQVMLTTLVVAAFSASALCHLAVVGRALQIVGFIGIAASGLALIAALVLIWRDWSADSDSSFLYKSLGIFSVLAVSFAHANLLLLLGARKRTPIRVGLMLTLAAIGLLALLIILPIITDGEIPGEAWEDYWRVLGVVAILDVLGTIVVPVAGIFVRDAPVVSAAGEAIRQADAPPQAPRPIAAGASVVTLQLSSDLDEWLTREAATWSISREQAALNALRRASDVDGPNG